MTIRLTRSPMALAVIATFAFGSPTFAGDGSCVWKHLSVETRIAAMNAGLAGGPKALGDSITPEQTAAAEAACGLKPDKADIGRRAESGYLMQVLAERWLSTRADLSPTRLGVAWTHMDAKARNAMDQWATNLKEDPQAFDAANRAFKVALGNPHGLPADAKPIMLTYLQGRALRAVYEPLF